MIQHEKDGAIFVHRVAAVIIDSSRVLLHRTADEDFWTLPGGRVELMETAVDGISREMREELGVKIHVERLLWVMENFINYQGQDYHEVGLYFLAKLPSGAPQLAGDGPFSGLEEHFSDQPLELIFQWFPLGTEALAEINLLPASLRSGLVNLPLETTLLLNRVIKT